MMGVSEVFAILETRPDHFWSASEVCVLAGVSVDSVRDALKVLVKRGEVLRVYDLRDPRKGLFRVLG